MRRTLPFSPRSSRTLTLLRDASMAHRRVYFDYGCALGDFRAAYKAKGEA